MDIGYFDEDIFGAAQCRTVKPPPFYQPKIYEKKWFFGGQKLDGQNDAFFEEKYQADWLYHESQFEEAQVIYEKLRTHAVKNRPALLREINESLVRCMVKQEQMMLASELLSGMLDTYSEDASLWLLLSRIYQVLHNVKGEIGCLQKCISLNSWNHQVWYSLALAYLAEDPPISAQCDNREEPTATQSHFYSYCCLLRAKFLLEKSLEKSITLMGSKNRELLSKVNQTIAAHAGCQCSTNRVQIMEDFPSLVVGGQSEEAKVWKTHLQQTCQEFEMFWFGLTRPSDPDKAAT